MGYSVAYRCTLRVDDPSIALELSYDRGHYGWHGDVPPPDHPGEGLRADSTGEYRITIKDCKVRMKLVSHKFYDRYMSRLLALLKQRVPSLHGYVSCDMETFWIVTDAVLQGSCPSIHEYARVQYEASSVVQTARKRAREETTTSTEEVAAAVNAAAPPTKTTAVPKTAAAAWARVERATAKAAAFRPPGHLAPPGAHLPATP